MTTFLLGGGWADDARDTLYGPFLAAARAQAGGSTPTVACVVLDEGDGTEQLARWETALTASGDCAPAPVLVPVGGALDAARLHGAHALLVCGGLTPAYASALAPAADAVRAWLAEGSRPYAGFSAGAAVAAATAVVGGWRSDGVQVCPQDAGEDLDEVTVVPGLALVPFAVDVHAAQWGTLGRLAAAVAGGAVQIGVAVDENTVVTVTDDAVRVSGLGRAHRVTRADGGVQVVSFGDGERLEL